MKRLIVVFTCCIGMLAGMGTALADDALTVEEVTRALLPNEPTLRALGGVTAAEKPSLTMLLQFNLGSAELRDTDIPPLQTLGTALQGEKLRRYVYTIEGHTCDLGTDAFNLELSKKRANAVLDYLSTHYGLPREQFDVTGFGEKNPAVPNTNEAARKKNRRVVIKNTMKLFAAAGQSDEKIDVQVKSYKNGHEIVLKEGDTLTGNDTYSVEFQTGDSLHVYAYQVDTAGKLIRLFPNPDFSDAANPLEPGKLYRLPKHDTRFFLDEKKGRETIIVLAYPEAVAEPDKLCVSLLTTPAGKDFMLASAKKQGREVQTRGVMGIREEFKPENQDTPENPPIALANLIVWEQNFIHE